jgi:hypothetical protein
VLHATSMHDDLDVFGAQHAGYTRANTAARSRDQCTLASQS